MRFYGSLKWKLFFCYRAIEDKLIHHWVCGLRRKQDWKRTLSGRVHFLFFKANQNPNWTAVSSPFYSGLKCTPLHRAAEGNIFIQWVFLVEVSPMRANICSVQVSLSKTLHLQQQLHECMLMCSCDVYKCKQINIHYFLMWFIKFLIHAEALSPEVI